MALQLWNVVDNLKQAVFDGTDPNRELEHGQKPDMLG